MLTVWEPFQEVLARTGAGMTAIAGITDYIEIDRGYEEAARSAPRRGPAWPAAPASTAGRRSAGARSRSRRRSWARPTASRRA